MKLVGRTHTLHSDSASEIGIQGSFLERKKKCVVMLWESNTNIAAIGNRRLRVFSYFAFGDAPLFVHALTLLKEALVSGRKTQQQEVRQTCAQGKKQPDVSLPRPRVSWPLGRTETAELLHLPVSLFIHLFIITRLCRLLSFMADQHLTCRVLCVLRALNSVLSATRVM